MKFVKFLFLFITFYSQANADTIQLYRSIPLNAKVFTTDPVGNCYVVRDNNILIKYNAIGDSVGIFNEVKKGKITQIDATNPLRVLLYLADYSQVIILDNMMSIKSQFRLSALGIFTAQCIANSADGNIWVYDPSAGLLLKIDEKPSIRFSPPLRMVLEYPIEPIYMIEQERNLFVVDSVEGIKRFDQYGFFKAGYDFYTHEVQYFNDYLVYYAEPYLYSYHTLSFQNKKIELSNPESIQQVRVERDKVYVLRLESLDIYDLKER